MTSMVPWEDFYKTLHIENFIYFITSPQLQQEFLPVKLVFIAFGIFFLGAVLYFYINSSYLTYLFFQDMMDFFSWHSYSLKVINKRLRNITKKADLGTEAGFKLAIAEADDALRQILDDKGYEGENFDQLVENASKKVSINIEELKQIHGVRNSIIYDPQFKLDLQQARKILSSYEKAIKDIAEV